MGLTVRTSPVSISGAIRQSVRARCSRGHCWPVVATAFMISHHATRAIQTPHFAGEGYCSLRMEGREFLLTKEVTC